MKGMNIDMKKILAIFLVAAFSLSTASCGKKKVDTSNSNNEPALTETGEMAHVDGETSAIVDSEGNAIPGTAADNAGAEVDMSKVDGKELSVVGNETNDSPASGTIGNFEVSIDEAKVIEADGNKAIVISYTFKNNTSNPMSFDGIMATEVTQNGLSLQPTVITGIDGINIHSAYESVDAGKKTTLQKTFVISDTESAVDVVVYKYAEPNGEQIAKSFKLN